MTKLEEAISETNLTRGTVPAQFCSDWLKDQITLLFNRIEKLEVAAQNLRQAQKSYMANRGNQEFGKTVAVAAKELDRVLEE